MPDDTTAPERHATSVPNPCGVTREGLFGNVGNGTHVCDHIPDHAEAADDREHICSCGFVWDDAEARTAPVTAEDLRKDLYATMREVQGPTVAGAVAAALYVFIPVMERFRKAVEDAPAVATWTGACVECGNAIEDGDRITWRLRWSPQGPIHEECR